MMVQDTFAERLFTMKINSRLVCFVMTAAMAVCAMTACGDSAENTSSSEWTPHKFGISDTTANGVKLNMTVDEVKAAIGEPDKEENITEDQFIYGEHLNMTYGQMHLSFYDINEGNNLKLSSISSNSPEVNFAGGLHVGNTKDEVLGAFTQEEDTTDLMLYGEKYGSFIYGDLISDYFIERSCKLLVFQQRMKAHKFRNNPMFPAPILISGKKIVPVSFQQPAPVSVGSGKV